MIIRFLYLVMRINIIFFLFFDDILYSGNQKANGHMLTIRKRGWRRAASFANHVKNEQSAHRFSSFLWLKIIEVGQTKLVSCSMQGRVSCWCSKIMPTIHSTQKCVTRNSLRNAMSGSSGLEIGQRLSQREAEIGDVLQNLEVQKKRLLGGLTMS